VSADVRGVGWGTQLRGARGVEVVEDFFVLGGAEDAAGAVDVFGADGWRGDVSGYS
jgi:hypothetical protein